MKRPTILLAEDDPNDVVLVQRVFNIAKIDNPLQIVSDGVETIDYIQGRGKYADRTKHPYPILLLLDLKMPKRSGFEVLYWLQNEIQSKALHVVVLTTARNLDEIKMSYDLGALSFLLKPLVFPELANLIEGLPGIVLHRDKSGYVLDFAEKPFKSRTKARWMKEMLPARREAELTNQ